MLPARGLISGLALYTGPADVILASRSGRLCTGSTTGERTVGFTAAVGDTPLDKDPPIEMPPARRGSDAGFATVTAGVATVTVGLATVPAGFAIVTAGLATVTAGLATMTVGFATDTAGLAAVALGAKAAGFSAFVVFTESCALCLPLASLVASARFALGAFDGLARGPPGRRDGFRPFPLTSSGTRDAIRLEASGRK